MSGNSLNTLSNLQCPHMGAVQITSFNMSVSADNAHAALSSDQFVIVGCPFQIPVGAGTVPSPCVKVQWILTDTRVKVNGNPTLSSTSVGLCLNAQQIPQGPVTIKNTQKRVTSA